MNLPLIVSKDKKIPLRRRLEAALIKAIDTERLLPGAPLPSSRDLASTTGISRATVVRVYEELVRTGYLESRGGGKTYVKNRPLLDTHRYSAPTDRMLADTHLDDFARHLLQLNLSKGSSGDQPSLLYGAPPKWALPVKDWRQILRKNCTTIDLLQLEYLPHPFGSMTVRKSVASYLNRTHGLMCSADQVLVSTNSQSPLNYIAQLFINKGDTVITESPGHVGARNIFKACGANIRSVPIDADGIIIDALEKSLDKTVKIIYVSPSFHDPTGVCMSLERRHQLLELARKHNVLVVEDAWDSDHSFISPHLPSLQSISAYDGVFFIYSFWKVLYPLSMVGCLVVPPQFIHLFEKAKALLDGINPVIEHYTLAEMIEEGHLERHLKTVKRQLKEQRQKLLEVLVSTFRSSVYLPKQSGAYWLSARFDESMSEETIRQKAEHLGLNLVSTQCFYDCPQDYPKNEFIIPFVRAT